MLGRVVAPGTTTTYLSDYNQKKYVKNIRPSPAAKITTGSQYCPTQKTLYQTSISEQVENNVYTRPRSFKSVLYDLPPQYKSTAKEDLTPSTGITDYTHAFGVPGQMSVKRSSAVTARQLSKTTTAETAGTPKLTYHPPHYSGYIPRETKANTGKRPHEDKSTADIIWQYHPMKTGFAGYVPQGDMVVDTKNLKHTETTYRAMCDEVTQQTGFRLND